MLVVFSAFFCSPSSAFSLFSASSVLRSPLLQVLCRTVSCERPPSAMGKKGVGAMKRPAAKSDGSKQSEYWLMKSTDQDEEEQEEEEEQDEQQPVMKRPCMKRPSLNHEEVEDKEVSDARHRM